MKSKVCPETRSGNDEKYSSHRWAGPLYDSREGILLVHFVCTRFWCQARKLGQIKHHKKVKVPCKGCHGTGKVVENRPLHWKGDKAAL